MHCSSMQHLQVPSKSFEPTDADLPLEMITVFSKHSLQADSLERMLKFAQVLPWIRQKNYDFYTQELIIYLKLSNAQECASNS